MAILLDFHSTIISHIMIMSRDNDNFYIDEQTLRQKILYSIKKYKKLFGREYGQILISCDGKDYWRKTLFPYYKIGRKTHREESNIDWDEIHNFMDLIKEEIKVHTHYPVVQVNEAESDDVIAILAEHLAGQKNIIISEDKDMIQCLSKNVSIYKPIRDILVVFSDDPSN